MTLISLYRTQIMRPKCVCITYLSIISYIVRSYWGVEFYVQFGYVGFEKWMCLCWRHCVLF